MLRRTTLVKRLIVRLAGALFFSILSLPGLIIIWGPIFLVTRIQSQKQMKSGPIFDTYDEGAPMESPPPIARHVLKDG